MDESRKDEAVAGNLQDYKDLAKAQVCPHCGYCPTCHRPIGNWNFPQYPYYPYQPITPMYQVYCGATTGNPPPINTVNT